VAGPQFTGFGVVGGAADIGSNREDQPVSFYRFKKKQQKELLSEMYRDPFDPNVEINVDSVRNSRNNPLPHGNMRQVNTERNN